MLFNSPVYLFMFLPVVVLVYYTLNARRLVLMAKIWLVLSSLFFYGFWNPAYLLLIISSVLFNFAIGRALHPNNRVYGTFANKLLRRKVILTVGVLFNLGLLGYFKYADFFIANYNHVSGDFISPLNLVLPLAISFFTFQQIAYLVDSYQSDTQEYDFLNYCLFVTFFPQLIAGPIVHHREMMPQFRHKRSAVLKYRNVAMGLFIISMGLLKKIYIADSFAVWANTGFDGHEALGFFQAWGASLSYTFQLYYDFSGYTDMAIGSALLFNIHLPVNFNSPYKATSIRDFWRRWHMTLSRWLRDYIYIPLGGNRRGNFQTLNNLFVTFLFGGLWHGAGWTFIAWGAAHGVAMGIHRGWELLGLQMNKILAWATTFIFINFSWVLFRADSINDANLMFKGMIGLHGFDIDGSGDSLPSQIVNHFNGIYSHIKSMQPLLIPFDLGRYVIIFGLFALIMPNSQQLSGYDRNSKYVIFGLGYRLLAIQSVILLLVLFILLSSHPSEFLYFNF